MDALETKKNVLPPAVILETQITNIKVKINIMEMRLFKNTIILNSDRDNMEIYQVQTVSTNSSRIYR